uniref:Uncharacterized protein n=1 Tax=Anguilla anguilla TaxID=7936 RepID=A0A0E9WV27_ANGAN
MYIIFVFMHQVENLLYKVRCHIYTPADQLLKYLVDLLITADSVNFYSVESNLQTIGQLASPSK